jgi:putative transposase
VTAGASIPVSPHFSEIDQPRADWFHGDNWGIFVPTPYRVEGLGLSEFYWRPGENPPIADIPEGRDSEHPIQIHNYPCPWPTYVDGIELNIRAGETAHTEALFAAVSELQVARGFALLDQYDHSEGSPVEFGGVFRAHVLRCMHGWRNETALYRYLCENPFLVPKLGFDGIPDQSTLWRAWEDRFTETVREAIRTAAERLTERLRDRGYALPDRDLRPKDTDAESDRSERRVRQETTKDVWNAAQPIISDCLSLPRERGHIPENAFWELHAFCGMREDMTATSGAEAFMYETTRSWTPTGATQRNWLTEIDHERTRRMFRETARSLVARAKANDELGREVVAAIDVTKGPEWTGQNERDERGELTHPYRLGYKNADIHHQYAVIKVVGLDVPLILDLVPRVRDQSKAEIVATLLDGALDILSELDLVLMDREFDSDGVKAEFESRGVHYLNPARVRSSDPEADMIRGMAHNGERYRLTEQATVTGAPSRKVAIVPTERNDFGTTPDDVDLEAEGESSDIRQEMLDEFGLEEDDMPGGRTPFDGIIEEYREDENLRQPASNHAYVPFETNLPLDVAATDTERDHQIGRLMRTYARRWGIENGFKKVKTFLPGTTSPDAGYRYFNFAFACILYNVWRLVDLLVKLALQDDPDYTPLVTAPEFLTLTKRMGRGLDPPGV